jgi:two-component system chemotaxis response regulator CheB
MPPLFTEPLAASLSAKCAIHVKQAVNGECARPGNAYLAPGGRHMKLSRGPRGEAIIRITEDPPENNCRPAVDYLFRSAALEFPGRSVAVILTGMGQDGTLGLRQLKRGGCISIAQDEASCVVFGMPKEAIQAGVVDIVAPLDSVAREILRAVGEGRV